MTQPMVGVTWSGDLIQRSARPGENALRYLELVCRAEMIPVLLTPGSGVQALRRVDGLVLTGGPDIAPSAYGQQPDDRLGTVAPELDELELQLVRDAQARHMPVLGICRGQQLVNVALGGTLHQHISHPRWGDDPSQPVHDVRIVAGTHLHRTLGANVVRVNSGHHQAVDVIAAPLRASAFAADGCVEGLEAERLLTMAVQWHPEETPDAPTSTRLMSGFAQWFGQ